MPDLSDNQLLIDGCRVHYGTYPSGSEFSVTYEVVRDLNILSCMKAFQEITPPSRDEVLADLSVDLGEHKFYWEEDLGQIALFLKKHDSLNCEFNILTGIKIEYDRFYGFARSAISDTQFAIDSIRPVVNEFIAQEGQRASEWQVIILCRPNVIFRDLFRLREEISRVSYFTGIDGDDENLLFRFYVPSGRLYATEADRLLSLFRDWLTGVGRYSVRQDGYRTAAGQVYEFYGDRPLNRQELSEEFANFLAMCSEDPSAAVASLIRTGFDRSSAEAVVARYGREIRRLRLDLKQERESRLLAIRHSLESDFLDSGLDSRQWDQISKFIEDLVPEAAIPPLPLLAVSNMTSTSSNITINQRIIGAVESAVIRSIQGTTNIGTQASELLGLINHFGGQDTQSLESAVYEFEDPDARPSGRRRAKNMLRGFLLQLGGKIEDVTLTALAKYLETKMGI